MQSIQNPNIEITAEDIENFLEDGIEQDFYLEEGNGNFTDRFDDERDISEEHYLEGGDKEDKYDEEYYIEKSIYEHESEIEEYFKYANISITGNEV